MPRRRSDIDLFTDPACPFAFSAEPVRRRLRWHYGDGLEWTPRMIVLTREPGEAEKLAAGAPNLPAHPWHADRSGAVPAAGVVGARVPGRRRGAPPRGAAGEPLLRRLRVRVMQNGLLDDPALIEVRRGRPGISRQRWRHGPARLRRPPRSRRTPRPRATRCRRRGRWTTSWAVRQSSVATPRRPT